MHGKTGLNPHNNAPLEPAMIAKHFAKILYVCGVITLLPIALFFMPWPVFSATGMMMTSNTGILFAKHWGLMAACFGGLLIYAGMHPEVRRPIVIAAAIEKLGLCVIIAVGWNDRGYEPFHSTLFVDGLMVILFGLYLIAGGDSHARFADSRRTQL
jgi:hypothetical protein